MYDGARWPTCALFVTGADPQDRSEGRSVYGVYVSVLGWRDFTACHTLQSGVMA